MFIYHSMCNECILKQCSDTQLVLTHECHIDVMDRDGWSGMFHECSDTQLVLTHECHIDVMDRDGWSGMFHECSF